MELINNFSNLDKAKVKLMLTQPFFCSVFLKRKLTPTKQYKTACTDGVGIFYNPDFFATLTISEIVFVLCHEVLHIVFLHHQRQGLRELKRFNYACDYAINLILKDAGLILPVGCLLDEAYRGMTPEKIYELLDESVSYSTTKLVILKKDGQTSEAGDDEIFDCGQVTSAQYSSKKERDDHVNQIKADFAEAMHSARIQGKIPAGFDRHFEFLQKATVNWKEELAGFLNENFGSIISFAKPNRRFLQNGFVLPGRQPLKRGRFVLAVDTSGSITETFLSKVSTEILDILTINAETLQVVYFDAKVAGTQELEEHGLANIKPVGGAGTDFSCVINYLKKEDHDTQVLIYFTDGECDSYAPAPDYPVMWVTNKIDFNPPYGETILLNDAA